MLDLVHLSPRRIFPPGGEDLYRRIGSLTNLSAGQELLSVACGKGVALEYFVREYGVNGTGVDQDPGLVSRADAHFKMVGLGREATFQSAPPSDLPFRDETFDVVMGEVELTASVEPEAAIRELAIVSRGDPDLAANLAGMLGLGSNRKIPPHGTQ